MSFIICLRCKRYRKHNSKGYCQSCYQYIKRKEKSDKSPKIKCQCEPNCKTMINSININNKSVRYAVNHVAKGYNSINYKNGRKKINGYWALYKPYYKYCHKNRYVQEHRYIMYLYLSILNNKIIYLPKNKEVHHINGNRLDNRIENLQLLTRKQHKKKHRKKIVNQTNF